MLQYDCEVCANPATYKCDMCVHNEVLLCSSVGVLSVDARTHLTSRLSSVKHTIR